MNRMWYDFTDSLIVTRKNMYLGSGDSAKLRVWAEGCEKCEVLFLGTVAGWVRRRSGRDLPSHSRPSHCGT